MAAEALINGIPVLASRRGALPEVLREAGFLFEVPAQYTPDTRVAPTADEVATWIEMIVRLWADHEFYERECERSVAAAEIWRPELLVVEHEAFFERVLSLER